MRKKLLVDQKGRGRGRGKGKEIAYQLNSDSMNCICEEKMSVNDAAEKESEDGKPMK